jgi:hypothetical protein
MDHPLQMYEAVCPRLRDGTRITRRPEVTCPRRAHTGRPHLTRMCDGVLTHHQASLPKSCWAPPFAWSCL